MIFFRQPVLPRPSAPTSARAATLILVMLRLVTSPGSARRQRRGGGGGGTRREPAAPRLRYAPRGARDPCCHGPGPAAGGELRGRGEADVAREQRHRRGDAGNDVGRVGGRGEH